MDRYQLASLVKWAGTLHSRKRLQKVVYLLQAAGCDLDVEYALHHYGPYSQDVASLADEMVQADLLREQKISNTMVGSSFSYELSDRAQEQLKRIEEEGNHRQRLGVLADFENLAQQLVGESNLQKLEYAATVAYFHARHPEEDWGEACQAAARFKRLPADHLTMRDAVAMAQEVVNVRGHG